MKELSPWLYLPPGETEKCWEAGKPNGTAGEQNSPPQNVSLACKLFPDENNQGLKDSGRTLAFLLTV